MGSMFPYHLRRFRPLGILMIAVKAGLGTVKLVCPVCGYVDDRVEGLTSTEVRRQPCPKCNGLSPRRTR